MLRLEDDSEGGLLVAERCLNDLSHQKVRVLVSGADELLDLLRLPLSLGGVELLPNPLFGRAKDRRGSAKGQPRGPQQVAIGVECSRGLR